MSIARVTIGALLLAAGCDTVFGLHRPADAPPDQFASGCSDGQGDGLLLADIVACAAAWPGSPSLRAPPTGAPCGNNRGPCAVPADACAAGWHVCGASGQVAELYSRMPPAECDGLTGTFVAAVSHCGNPTAPPCTYDVPLPCLDALTTCAEPVCCGTGCSLPSCADGVFPGATRKADTISCGMALASAVTGVLCCRD